jgi:hypothetical protein
VLLPVITGYIGRSVGLTRAAGMAGGVRALGTALLDRVEPARPPAYVRLVSEAVRGMEASPLGRPWSVVISVPAVVEVPPAALGKTNSLRWLWEALGLVDHGPIDRRHLGWWQRHRRGVHCHCPAPQFLWLFLLLCRYCGAGVVHAQTG